MSAGEHALEHNQYLTFQLGGEEYAIGILQVKEIIAYGILTKIPQAPASIRGVINLRGNVVAVADLAVKFGLPSNPITDRSCIIIVEIQAQESKTAVGIIADSVNQVIDLAANEILPAPAFGTDVRLDYLRGMGNTGQKFVLLLDIDKVLTADAMSTPTGVKASHAEAGAVDSTALSPVAERSEGI